MISSLGAFVMVPKGCYAMSAYSLKKLNKLKFQVIRVGEQKSLLSRIKNHPAE